MTLAPDRLWLEDLREGQSFRGGPTPVTGPAIQDFAAAFDPQPFHLETEAAAGTFFGGLAASGWHVAALTMRMMVETLPFGGGLIGAGGTIAWPRPTRPGDRLRILCTIEQVTPSRSRPDRGMIRLRTETLNQDDAPVQILTADLVVFRRP
ncbi:MAG: MaoC family dehydratase N-terminal domain-containing protein [Amaricoccus sp.]